MSGLKALPFVIVLLSFGYPGLAKASPLVLKCAQAGYTNSFGTLWIKINGATAELAFSGDRPEFPAHLEIAGESAVLSRTAADSTYGESYIRWEGQEKLSGELYRGFQLSFKQNEFGKPNFAGEIEYSTPSFLPIFEFSTFDIHCEKQN